MDDAGPTRSAGGRLRAARGLPAPSLVVATAVAAALATTITPATAQDVDIPAFNTLTNPPGPAWTLLGVEPSAVERPATPTALGLSLLRTVEDGGSFPDQWAVELSPWWMLSRPDLEWRDDLERTVPESLLRTLSVSVATARSETEGRPVTSLAAALRVSLVSGRVPARTRARAAQLEAMLTAVAVDASERALVIRRRLGIDSIFRVRATEDLEAAQRWLQAQEDSIEVLVRQSADHAELRTAAEELQLNAATREGFFLELAAGWAVDVPRNVVDSASTRQLGIWLSPSWIGEGASVVGVLRYLSDPLDRLEFDGALDAGGRILVQRPRLGLSVEAVYRRLALEKGLESPAQVDRNDWRLAGILEYRVTTELWARATFGRDFQRTGAGGGLLARISVSLDVGGKRYRIPVS